MCGILGYITYNSKIDKKIFSEALDTLKSRGPDDFGIWNEENIWFGHRRLSILDLSSMGHQPMEDEETGNVISYNGEVYNFLEIRDELKSKGAVFKSNSDTEVILKAYRVWGIDCLRKFNGMFAFAIKDNVNNKLYLARDRVGIKPLYYHLSSNCFAFSSRPNALKKLLKNEIGNIDYQSLRYYLEMGYIPYPYSFYEGIKKLAPGHFAEYDLDSKFLKLSQYWSFSKIEPDMNFSNDEDILLDELDSLILDSVKLRMISDVPLGTFLSGGIDSSLITAIMQKHSSTPVKTFTIGFKESDNDESLHAKSVAEFLKTDHCHEYLNPDNLIDFLPDFFRQYDEPFYDHSAFPVMAVSRLTRKHVTVALSGDGGDELFGGYHYYQIIKKLTPFYVLPYHLRNIGSLILKQLPYHKAKLLASALNKNDIVSAFSFSRSVIKDFNTVITDELRDSTNSFYEYNSRISEDFSPTLKPEDIAMRLDMTFTLVDDYLQKVDVGTMAFSLENRVPFLDYRIVEWSQKLPCKWKMKNGINKYLLRKLAYRYIPKYILDKPKQGFGVPMDDWLKGPLKGWAEERLQDLSSFKELKINHGEVINIWDKHLSGKRNSSPILWSILVLIEFLENSR